MADEIKSRIVIETSQSQEEIRALSKSLRELADELKKTRKGFGEVKAAEIAEAAERKKNTAAAKESAEALDKESAAKNNGKKSAVEFLKTLGKTYLSFTAVVRALRASYTAYLQLDAGIAQVNNTLGASAEIVKEFAESNASAFGLSERMAYRYAGTYSLLLQTLTRDQEQNAKASVGLLQLTAVVASHTGRTVQDVAERIRSGLLGNTEAIEDLGINVNVALLKTTAAFRKIAGDRSWEQLTFNEQQQVRYLAIMEQGAAKFGYAMADNAMTNLQRFNAELDNLKATGGEVAAGALNPILKLSTQLFSVIASGLSPLNGLNEYARGALMVGSGAAVLLPTIISKFRAAKFEISTTAAATMLLTGALSGLLLISSVISQKKQEKEAIEGATDAREKENAAIEEGTKAVEEYNKANGGGLMGIDELNSLKKVGSTNGTGTGDLTNGYGSIDDMIAENEKLAGSYEEIAKSITESAKAGNIFLGVLTATQLAVGIVTLAVKLHTAAKIKDTATTVTAAAAEGAATTATKIKTVALWEQTAAQKALNLAKTIGIGLGVGLAAFAVGSIISSAVAANTPQMATGGVITAPTLATIGEGRYPEAVIPLEDSPQMSRMKSDIADEVVRRLGGGGKHTTVVKLDKKVLLESVENELVDRVTERLKINNNGGNENDKS